MKIVPLSRAHLKGAVKLHRSSRPWCYRGKNAACVLRAFYDACANRDYTVGTVALEAGKVVGVMCGATDPTAPAEWLRRRRPWRSFGARLLGGPNMARGGWEREVLEAAGAEGPSVYLLAAVTAEGTSADDVATLFDFFAAAAASRGARRVVAPAAAPDERLRRVGFDPAAAFDPREGAPLLYVRSI